MRYAITAVAKGSRSVAKTGWASDGALEVKFHATLHLPAAAGEGAR